MKIIKRERWLAKVNENDYDLDEKQAEVLNKAIASNSRGIVQFDGFIVSIPYLQEFYRVKSWEEQEYTKEELEAQERLYLATTRLEQQEEERKREIWEKQKLKWEKEKGKIKKVLETKKTDGRISPEEFENRRKKLLAQAKNLLKNEKQKSN